MELFAFYNAGGFDSLARIADEFRGAVDQIAAIRSDDRTELERQELALAYGGLRVLLRLVQPLVSSKPMFESTQTILCMTKDKKDTEPGYFDPSNFLVQLRLASLPILRSLWSASWLDKAPVTVIRAVSLPLLEVIKGDNEEPQPLDPNAVAPATAVRRAPVAPDENRISQLTDMGFPRSAAERALIRTHNNVSAATEYLLAHPLPFPPDPPAQIVPLPAPPADEPLADADPDDSPALPEEASPNPAADDVAPVESTSIPAEQADPDAMVIEPSQPVEELVPEKGREELRQDLTDSRASLLQTMPDIALSLIDVHISLIFDLHTAFTKTGEHGQKSVRKLITDIKNFSPQAFDVQEQPLSSRCRLLALILGNTPSSLIAEHRTELMDALLALLLSNPRSAQNEHPAIPAWMASHLLVTEALFALAEEPREITLPKDEESIQEETLAVGPSFAEARGIVFDFSLRLLGSPDLPSDEFLAVLRLLVLLTRDSTVAESFVARGGLSHLFERLYRSTATGSSSYVAILLRHLVEDATTITRIMEQGIRKLLNPARSRGLDVSAYVRSCSAMALRDPQAFISATKSVCHINAPFASFLHIHLKEEEGQKTEGQGSDMQVDSPTNRPRLSNEHLEAVVHFLVSELMRTTKDVTTSTSEAPTAESGGSGPAHGENIIPAGDKPPASEDKDQDKYFYPCFLMQCLTELLFSYEACKVAFLSFTPKKKNSTPGKEPASKHRSATLTFLLNDLISFGTINPKPQAGAKGRIALCNWAMSVIVALCVDTSAQDHKEISSELTSVRKYALEAVNRCIKEFGPAENTDTRYGRLLALADLCHRLLTVRFNSGSRKNHDENPTHIAKIMLDRGFVAALTSALHEIDLNYPNVKGLIAAVLRPLEYL